MEDGLRSGRWSGTVENGKNTSGCLNSSRKCDGMSEAGSLEPLKNLQISFEKGLIEETDNWRKQRFEHGMQCDGSVELEIEKKKSNLDVFEFDEYDGIDGDNDRNEHAANDSEAMPKSGGYPEYGKDCSKPYAVYKRRHSFLDSSVSLSTEKKSNSSSLSMSRSKMKKDEDPDVLSKDKFGVIADELIRLQGKNGVLKMIANKKNKVEESVKCYNGLNIDGDAISSSKSPVCPSTVLETKLHEKSSCVAMTVKLHSGDQNLTPKKKRNIISESDVDDSDGSEASSNPETSNSKSSYCSLKQTKSEVLASSSKKSDCTSYKNGKANQSRLRLTEKQLLREQIKKILLSAGWRIDYRPRIGRNYLDSVYISPTTGSGYWSILKAYHAFQASEEYHPLALISEDILRKLTRQTQKKIQKEMEMKQATEKDKLCYFMRQRGMFIKGRLQKDDNLNGDNSISVLCKQENGSRRRGRGCSLLVRSSNKAENSGRRGLKKLTLLSWMIDSGALQSSEKVHYMNGQRTRSMLEGWITRDGIHCKCCRKIISVSKFEIHAGSKLNQPFQNICLKSGVSLLQCQLDAWNKQEKFKRSGFLNVDTDGNDPNDDTCSICGDGGDLICCDGCPSTFHLSCLQIQMLPPGDWHCPNCSCKFCGVKGDNFAGNLLFKCRLCEQKYHDSCISKTGDLHRSCSISPTSFCGQKCKEVYERLQKLLGIKHELESGFSWTLIQRTDPENDKSIQSFSQRVECNSKLAVALGIMDECFLPIIDRRSGINLIHNVLYNFGSNFNRLDFSGFYTVILERGDEIISSASIRIRGSQLAEMPFIGTRHMYRRQGMCRRLLSAIESVLSSLKVEKLIIPAISDLMHTWTVVFGFNPIEESHKQKMRNFNMLVFLETDMLEKVLIDQEMTEANPTDEKRIKLASATSYSDGVCDLKTELCIDEKKEAETASDNKFIPSSPINDVDLETKKPVSDADNCEYLLHVQPSEHVHKESSVS